MNPDFNADPQALVDLFGWDKGDGPLIVNQIPEPKLTRVQLSDHWEPNDHNLDLIWNVAITGATDAQIATVGASVTDDCWAEIVTKYPIVSETIQSARRVMIVRAATVVYNRANDVMAKDRVQCNMFLLKNVPEGSWSEKLVLSAAPQKVQPHELKEITGEELMSLLPQKTDDSHLDE